MTKHQTKANQLLAKFPIKKALKVADHHAMGAESDAQAYFWELVAEKIVMSCTDPAHDGETLSECPTCGDVL